MVAFSNRGTLVYLSGRSSYPVLSIQWLNRTGKLSPLRAATGYVQNPQFSPDGTKLAVQVFDVKNRDLWVYEWGRDTMSRLTFDVNTLSYPVWAPDGRGIVFDASRDSTLGSLYWRRADGPGEAQLLTKSKNFQFATSWHPSGKRLTFTEWSPQTGYDVMILPIEGDEGSGLKPGQPTPFPNGPPDDWQAVFSHDGRWLAYSSNESGRVEVYVRPFPGPGGKWQISTEGGSYPTWSRNGRELFYEALYNRLMVAAYAEQGGSFHAEKPRPWCEVPLPDMYAYVIRTFNLHPDGQGFAVFQEIVQPDQAKRDEVVLFQNFFDELRRLAPIR